MPVHFGVDYYVVGEIRTPAGFSRELLCTKKPSIQMANLLYMLSKHVSRIIEMDDLCYQLKCSPNAIRILTTYCRKILHYDWTIEGVNSKGLRLCYIGGDLADADFTYLVFNPEILDRRSTSRHYDPALEASRRLSRVRFRQQPVKKPRARLFDYEPPKMEPIIAAAAMDTAIRVRARL